MPGLRSPAVLLPDKSGKLLISIFKYLWYQCCKNRVTVVIFYDMSDKPKQNTKNIEKPISFKKAAGLYPAAFLIFILK